MSRIVLDALGIALMATGFVTFPLPIPVGALFIAVGLILLTISESRVREWVREVRKKNTSINKAFLWIASHTPQFIKTAIHRTDPK